MTYIIKYKEFNRDWSSTSYTTPEEVTEEFLISFFGLHECEDFVIEQENDYKQQQYGRTEHQTYFQQRTIIVSRIIYHSFWHLLQLLHHRSEFFPHFGSQMCC